MRAWIMGTITGALAAWPLIAGAGPDGLAGNPAPDFALKDTRGDNQRLSEFRGQVVLLSFWAEWCGRCSLQLNRLAELQKQYADRGLKVIAVNIDEAEQPAREAAARLGVTVLRDRDRSVARQYDLSDLPLALMLDPTGQVRHVHEKYADADPALYESELLALLRE